MDDVAQAAQTIGNILKVFTSTSGLRLRYRVKARHGRTQPTSAHDSQIGTSDSRALHVDFTGPDTRLLIANNGEVLNALEHIATKILRLEPEDHELVCFDADRYKERRDHELRKSAVRAIERVRATGREHAFPAMSSRERRMLHLLLKESNLTTASRGEGAARFVVLYPPETLIEPNPHPSRTAGSLPLTQMSAYAG